jgi:xanthine dehydrogenase YagT iron-sulfur-binding subunit
MHIGEDALNRKSVGFTLNGRKVEGFIEPRMTLAEFLREELGLTGTKVGCNRGECGCCTVILDGNAVYSCSILAVEVAGREVLTIEGLEHGALLHPIQEAFVENDAAQCGYCAPGMIMSVKALLGRNLHPKESDIKKAIEGNLCRCGSYPNIIRAALAASHEMARSEEKKS